MTFRFIEDLATDEAVYRAAIATCREVQNLSQNADEARNTWTSEQIPQYMANGGGFFSGPSQLRSFKNYGPWKLTFFVASDQNNIVVAIEGTKHSIHHEMNGSRNRNKGVPSPVETGLNGVMVHPGWSQGTDSIIGVIKSELHRQGASGKNILICGHSMGGCLGGYLTYRLMNEAPHLFHQKRDHRLITFGSPRYAAEVPIFGMFDSFDFQSSFQTLAKKCGLTPISVEMTGDDIVLEWLKRVPHVQVNRLGQPLTVSTSKDDKHGSKSYFGAIEKFQISPPTRLRLLRLQCHETSEFGEDEIFIQVSDGTRYPRHGEWDMDEEESRWIDPNGPGIAFTQSIMSVVVWEDDSTSINDRIGHLHISQSQRGHGVQKAYMTGDDGRYTLYYQVE